MALAVQSHRALLDATFQAALRATDPAARVRAALDPQEDGPPALIVSVGKASVSMCRAALERFPGTPALTVTPRSRGQEAASAQAFTDGGQLGEVRAGEVLLAGHPLPDAQSVWAADRLLARLHALHPGQRLLVLLSGGASALLCAPWGVTLAEKQALTHDLLAGGADIYELNAVRKHLSRLKGGRMAQLAGRRGVPVQTLLLSDVMGDDPSVIASGPTVPDPSSFADALAVLDRFGLHGPDLHGPNLYGPRHPAARRHLEQGARGELEDTPKPGSLDHENRVQVVGSNRHLLEAAATFLAVQGWPTLILGDAEGGEARTLAASHAAACALRSGGTLAILSGGETTVTVRGGGLGGRNQEYALALLLALEQSGQGGLWGLSAGSDGVDGRSDAAGAILTPDSLHRARALGLDPQDHLDRNDSGRFFAALGDALVTGPTGHNLNDLRVLLLDGNREPPGADLVRG